MRKFLAFVGVFFAITGLSMTISSVGDLVTGATATPGSTLVMLTAFFGMVAAAGGGLARHQLLVLPRRDAEARRFAHEQAILALAQSSGGRVALAKVAAKCELPIAEAKELLAQLCAQGVAEVVFSDVGEIEYFFHGLTEGQGRTNDMRAAQAASQGQRQA